MSSDVTYQDVKSKVDELSPEDLSKVLNLPLLTADPAITSSELVQVVW